MVDTNNLAMVSILFSDCTAHITISMPKKTPEVLFRMETEHDILLNI